MEKIHENIHVLFFYVKLKHEFLHLVPPFVSHYIIMVKGLLLFSLSLMCCRSPGNQTLSLASTVIPAWPWEGVLKAMEEAPGGRSKRHHHREGAALDGEEEGVEVGFI